MDDNQQKETLFEKHRENIYFRWGLTAFVVIVACIVVAQFVTKFTSFFGIVGSLIQTLSPVFYGLGIAYLLDPIVGRIQMLLQPHLSKRLKTAEKAERISRGIGVLCALIVLILVVWTLLSIILPQVLSSINTLVGNLPSYYNTLSTWVMGLIDDNIEMADFTSEIMDKVYAYFTDWLTDSLLPKVQSAVVSLTSSVNSGHKEGRLCVQCLHLCQPNLWPLYLRRHYRFPLRRHSLLHWPAYPEDALRHADRHYRRLHQHHPLLWPLSGRYPLSAAAAGH